MIAPALGLLISAGAWAEGVEPGLLSGAAWQDLTPLLLGAMLALMALLLTLLARLHTREHHALFLAGAMALWALRAGLSHSDLGISHPDLPQLLSLSLLPWAALCLIQYLLRGVGQRHAGLDLALLLQGVLLPATLGLLPAQQHWLALAWPLLLGLEVLAALYWHGRVGRAPRPALSMPWLLAGAAALPAALQPAPLGALLPLWLLGLGLHLVLAIAQARNEAEREQLAHEQRVQAKIADIERSFGEMAEQKLEQVTERERKRIAADLHDDLGAKLLTIVHTSESDRISTLAREALEEMRLSVRGLTGKPVQLLDALGDWRAEVVSRLGQANILAEWKSPAEDVIHTLPARAYVQTTRIFREAVSNIIKHSGATHCVVSCAAQGGDFLVVIQDNGQGISTELDGRLDKGHGMASMKSRAKQMHGQCLVESGPGWGTVIRLTIPL
jgi:signal transduction histidine kinase